jgi:hypothetical protein
MVRLPDDWVADLLDAARKADTDLFEGLVEPLYAANPQLGTALQELVNNFRFDVILELAEQLNGSSPVQGVGK